MAKCPFAVVRKRTSPALRYPGRSGAAKRAGYACAHQRTNSASLADARPLHSRHVRVRAIPPTARGGTCSAEPTGPSGTEASALVHSGQIPPRSALRISQSSRPAVGISRVPASVRAEFDHQTHRRTAPRKAPGPTSVAPPRHTNSLLIRGKATGSALTLAPSHAAPWRCLAHPHLPQIAPVGPESGEGQRTRLLDRANRDPA